MDDLYWQDGSLGHYDYHFLFGSFDLWDCGYLTFMELHMSDRRKNL
jgi:hypothetical protein